ncbi:MAG TPA: FAD-linked oxidase C-terminal domain-containing protein [Thermoleophilia bacterium]|nr:FAD-linked oxidase C-terminal domain-containing protein [Thermoleophilia bacterium]
MEPRHRIPELSQEGRAAADALRRDVAGEVSTSPLRRWLYSTDASGYRVVPEVVVVAARPDDLAAVAEVAADAGLPVTARGAASSVAGQAIGPGIAVDCFKLDRVVEIDVGRRTARVQPGVVQAALNAAAAPYGLEFGPDTSTVDQATIGGMVGNNSSGSRSIVYGETRDKVVRVTGALAGGERFTAGASAPDDLASGIGGPAGERLAAALAHVRERYREPIAAGFPQTRRCTSGYNLRELLAPEPNLGRLLAGSEGTLALFTELEVLLDPRPERRAGAALTFASLRAALEANVAVLETGPSAVEFLDLAPLRRAPNLTQYRSLAAVLEGSDAALLTVEYQGAEDEVLAGLGRLRALAGSLGAGQIVWLDEPEALADAAALRRAVLPLLMGAPGAERPAAFVEDTAVAPERLAEFVADLQRLLAVHGVRASFTGHASAGCLHLRPMLDLKTAAGVDSMQSLAAGIGRLVAGYHGAISGEHGCGRSRSWFLPQLLGPGLYEAMVAVKDAFDPRRLLNPGVIVDGPGVTEHLRFGADYRGDGAWSPRLSYSQEGGFGAAVEKCFGAGLCKKASGTMCPPAAATRDEARSTRARANALQGVVCGAVPLGAIGADEFRDVLGTCVACKACKTECPAGVDMAALKVEWLAEVRAREGVPPLARGIGDFRRLAALAAPAAPLVNALARTRAARLVTDRAGVAHERPLPAFARRPLTRRLGAGATAVAASGAPPAGAAAGRAVLFVDCFIQYQEPGIGEALARLLAAAGVTVDLADAGCCGRTALSTGQIGKARAAARRALDRLYPLVLEGADVLFVEPSCLSMVRDDWSRLLPDDPRVTGVATASRPALALVGDLAAGGRLRFRAGGHALLHSHCHEKALGFAAATLTALAAVPELEIEDPDAGCCGMSGVFGYEAEHYELSVAMAERRLLPAVRAARPDAVVLATGTSCRSQVRDLGGRTALHPLEFLAGRLVT